MPNPNRNIPDVHLDLSRVSPLTTKGDIYVRSTFDTRLPVGTDGFVLTADSTQATGLKWSAGSGGSSHDILSATHTDTLAAAVVRGDLIIGNATPKWSRLAVGASATFLRSNGTDPSWQTIVGADITGAALTDADDTNVTLTLGGTPATALLRAVSITAGWIGTLSVTRGGTGANLSATGGASQYVKQVTVGGAFTVGIIAAADLPGLFSGFATPAANSVTISAPTAGAATTAIRSDAGLQLSQAIVPTWTGAHTFSNTVTMNGAVNAVTGPVALDAVTMGSVTFIDSMVIDLASASLEFDNGLADTILYVSTGGAVNGISHVATGSILISQGVATPPIWSTSLPSGVGLTGVGTHKTLYTDGSSVIQGLAHVADGQVYSSKGTAVAPAYRTLNSTTNQVTVTTNAGNFTFSTPQDIHTAATPQFLRLGLAAAAHPTANFFISTGGAPANGQFLIGSTARIAMLAYNNDNSMISYDVQWLASAFTAQFASVAALYKTGGIFRIVVGAGNTPGSPVTDFDTAMCVACSGKWVGVGEGFTAPIASLQVRGLATTYRTSQKSETIDAGYGVVHPSDFTIVAGHTITLLANAILAVL